MLIKLTGNLIDLAEQGHFDLIVHGANTRNTMGSGIAKEIKERYPIAYDADTKASEVWKNGVAKLGNFSYAVVTSATNPFIIINAYTQLDYLPRGIDHFEYESFSLILKKILLGLPGKRVAFPYIGCGLAGGNQERIIQMLEDFAEKYTQTGGTVTLVEFKKEEN